MERNFSAEEINKACESLGSGDLIKINYDEGNIGQPIEVIATYSTHNPRGRNLTVGRRFVDKNAIDFFESTKLSKIGLAEYSEIKGIEKLVPQKIL